MNILYLCNEYTADLIGGIGSVAKTEASAMVKRGHRAFVAGSYMDTANPPLACEQADGITIIRWNDSDYHTFRLNPLKYWAKKCAQWRLRKIANRLEKVRAKQVFKRTAQLVNDLVNREHIDLIEIPDYYDDFYRHPFIVPDKPFTAPVVIRVHGSVSFIQYHSNGNVNPQILSADRSLFAQADAVSAVSEFSKQFVQEYLCSPGQKVDVFYNPIDDKLFEDSQNNPNTHTILFIGKINEAKGAYLMIEAFNEVSKSHPEVRLRMIGEGDIAAAKKKVESHCTDRVHFTGYLHHEKVIEEIDAATFCVLPSLFENFSMAALEVLARKRALIYTNRASGKELIADGINGLLVDPENIPQMVEKINILLDNQELRDKLAEKGYDMCRNRFSTDIIIPQIEQYYQSVIEQCKR